MARPSKFNPEARAVLIGGIANGLTLEDAARAAGVGTQTVKTWLRRGRKEESGEFAEFARAVTESRDKALPEPLTEDEHRRLVSAIARKGSVQALKLYWEIILADRDANETEDEQPADPLAGVDELAERRAA